MSGVTRRGERTTTYLEMTSPAALVPGRPAPAPVALEDASGDPAAVADAWRRIGGPYGWGSRHSWSPAQWAAWVRRPTTIPLLASVDGELAGMVELEVQPAGDVEITIFGLVPEFVGRGYGGHLLTEGLRRAWAQPQADGSPTRRVWLHTSSRDHAHALANYRARGLRIFGTRRG